MDEVVVYLAQALICFAGQCYPALVGTETPQGVFPLVAYEFVEGPIPRGLGFAQDELGRVYAVHTPAHGNKRRTALLASGGAIAVTQGCVNIAEATFKQLVESGASRITIRR